MTDAEREARRAQFQTAMEKTQTDSQSVKDKAIKLIGGVLTKNQKTTFNNLLGKPFDLTLLNDGRGPDNPFNPARAAADLADPAAVDLPELPAVAAPRRLPQRARRRLGARPALRRLRPRRVPRPRARPRLRPRRATTKTTGGSTKTGTPK